MKVAQVKSQKNTFLLFSSKPIKNARANVFAACELTKEYNNITVTIAPNDPDLSY